MSVLKASDHIVESVLSVRRRRERGAGFEGEVDVVCAQEGGPGECADTFRRGILPLQRSIIKEILPP